MKTNQSNLRVPYKSCVWVPQQSWQGEGLYNIYTSVAAGLLETPTVIDCPLAMSHSLHSHTHMYVVHSLTRYAVYGKSII